MPIRCLSRALGALLLLVIAAPAAAESRTGTLLPDTPFATEYHLIDTGLEGPSVVVVGGLNGNDPAGAQAADEAVRWPITRGRLLLIPRASEAALRSGTRQTPIGPDQALELNRAFPREKGASASDPLAQAIWQLIQAQEPDWLIDLHEDPSVRGAGGKGIGSSAVFADDDVTAELATVALEAVNAAIDDEAARFVPYRVSASSAGLLRAAGERHGIRSITLATTSVKTQRLPVRARQHRTMLAAMLHHVGMLAAPGDPGVTRAPGARLRVALYDDGGSPSSQANLVDRPIRRTGAIVHRIDAADIRAGALDAYDVVCFMGGSGSAIARTLRPAGIEAVRRFVEAGGEYIGVCAGAYLATSGYDWSLKILDARTLHTGNQWRRGRGEVVIAFTDDGRAILELEETQAPMSYVNGPVIGPAGRDDLPDYRILATFHTELAENGTPPGLMQGTPAIVEGTFGGGRVITISPHPEGRSATRHIFLAVLERAISASD